MSRRVLLIVFAALVSLLCEPAMADNCNWTPQRDGTTFGLCVDAKGNMYCLSCPAKRGACVHVPCTK